MISCNRITKQFGEVEALSEISFEVAAGRICALLGPNGAGKSTLVKILTGLLKASSGTAEVFGLPVSDPKLRWLIGVLPEGLALFDSLTILEHLDLTGEIYKLSRSEIRSRTDQLLRVLRLQEGSNTFISQCSYGMKKKTALAMALLPGPQVLFLDEPFEGIDPITAETIRTQLRAIAERGITVFLTSHILSLVDRIAHDIILIHKGRIAFQSSAADLPKSLEEIYFDTVEQAETEHLGWLGSKAS